VTTATFPSKVTHISLVLFENNRIDEAAFVFGQDQGRRTRHREWIVIKGEIRQSNTFRVSGQELGLQIQSRRQ
jgi:hypothetical protein